MISGDTTYDERMVEHARGADILVHEVYCEAGWARRTPEWRAYHARYHTSGPDLGCLAAKVRPRTLVLTHQLLMGPRERRSSARSAASGTARSWTGRTSTSSGRRLAEKPQPFLRALIPRRPRRFRTFIAHASARRMTLGPFSA